MTDTAARPADALKERSRLVLNRLIARGKPRKGEWRVQARRLSDILKEKHDKDDKAAALKLHLRGEARPLRQAAWDYGEHLRDLGVPWCSGLWMLWAVGRYTDVVGIVVTWLTSAKIEKAVIDDVWHALALATRLATPSALDHDPEFGKRHVQNDRLTRETYEYLWAWSVGIEPALIVRAYISYLDREIAKTPWLGLAPHREELQAAYATWNKNPRLDGTLPLGRLAQVAFAVAGSGIPVVDREAAALSLLAQWLTGVEENYQVPLFVRAVDPAYLTPLPKVFGPVQDDLPALGLPRLARIG